MHTHVEKPPFPIPYNHVRASTIVIIEKIQAKNMSTYKRGMKRPLCCDSYMIRASARKEVEGDPRAPSMRPYKAVGWYCQKCESLKSVIDDEEFPLL